MVFMQIVMTNPSYAQGVTFIKQPVVISVPLYGRYKTRVLSVQYNNFNAVDTVVRIESRQLMTPFAGSDQANLNTSSRYITLCVGNTNANQPILGHGSLDFITDWNGQFECMIIVNATNQPIADVGNNFTFIINMDVEPVDSESNVENNTLNQHMFVSMPVRTFAK